MLPTPGPTEKPEAGDASKRGVKRSASEELVAPSKQRAVGSNSARPILKLGGKKLGGKKLGGKKLGAKTLGVKKV